MPAVRGDGMRGLAVFISDIRNCKSKEAEVKRINKELANIRSKFKVSKFEPIKSSIYKYILLFTFVIHGHILTTNVLLQGDKTLDGYQKKKYVCKLLFIFLLGHDIDFGHMEAVNLLSSNKYTEKQIVSIFQLIQLTDNATTFHKISINFDVPYAFRDTYSSPC